MKSRITTLLVVATVATIGMAATAQAAGELTQKPGTAGCISEDTSKMACQDGRGLEGATAVAVSPDGKNAYVVAVDSEGVAILDRDPATGALTQRSGATACVTKDGNGGTCQVVKALAGAYGVAVSADGRNVYVAAFTGGVTIFDRDASTGALVQKAGTAGCISSDGSGGDCQKGTAIAGASSVVVTPDGKTAYVAAYTSSAVGIFDRDASTGALTQKAGTAGCVAEDGGAACQDGRALYGASKVTVSGDGRSVYATSHGSEAGDGLAILDRVPATGATAQKQGPAGCVTDGGSEGACQDSGGIDSFYDVAVSPDGGNVYVTAVRSGAIARFDRDASGALTRKQGVALGGGASEIAVSPDGLNVYAAMPETHSVAILDRAATGALTARPGVPGCVSETGSAGGCQDGYGLYGAFGVTVSPDGRNVYVASRYSDGVAVFDRAPAPPVALPQADRLAPGVSGFRVARNGRVRFTLSEAAAVRIVVQRTRPGRRVRVRTLSLSGHAGANTARLRIRARGRYRATITATDTSGNRSAPRRAGFRIVRKAGR